jgi:hypothetical protein
MAKVNWNNSSGGDFATGSDWSTGKVPGLSDTANINAVGTGTYTVTSFGSPTVLAITTIPTATLDVTGNSVFTALAGTGTGANAGTINVETGSVFEVGGTVKNTGIISLNGGLHYSGGYIIGALEIARDTILQGGGKITLTSVGGYSSSILGSTLTNVDNTISGSGQIGGGEQTNAALVNENKGVIDANGPYNGGLTIYGGVTNAGLLEATSTAGLVLQGPINNSASGVIAAFGAGANVTLAPEVRGDGVVIELGILSGGTLKTSGGGKIILQSETIDGSNGHTVTNTGSVLLSGATLLGTINNTGTIAAGTPQNSGINYSILVGAGGATLAGSGNITLSDSTTSEIIGNGTSTTLTNQNTISGAGAIGGNGLLLTNHGVIDATGTNPLIVDTGASAVTNTGTLEATGNSTLFVASNITNTGNLIANNGTDIFAGAVSGTGTATVQGAGSIEFGSTTTSNITFGSGGGTVTFDAASTLTGKLSVTGFTLGDTIDLANINFTGSGPSLAFNKGVLTVSDGTHTAKLNMVGNYTLASFHAKSDGSGGTLITDPPATNPPATSTTHHDLDHVVALFSQSIAAGFSDQHQHGMLNTNPLSQIVTNQEQFLANPHHG